MSSDFITQSLSLKLYLTKTTKLEPEIAQNQTVFHVYHSKSPWDFLVEFIVMPKFAVCHSVVGVGNGSNLYYAFQIEGNTISLTGQPGI